jgi:hypothetical protein
MWKKCLTDVFILILKHHLYYYDVEVRSLSKAAQQALLDDIVDKGVQEGLCIDLL